jgi:predicted phosphodiesterase
MKNFKKVAILGDKHLPYEDVSVSRAIMKIIAREKPDCIVQIGDLYDFWHASRYPKSMLTFVPEVEVKIGRRQAEKFWNNIHKLAPRAVCYQIKGNHDDRPYKRMLERAPELEPFIGESLKGLFEFKGVTTIHNSRQELEISINGNRILFHHGHRSQLGAHLLFNQQSTVVGHSHIGGVVFKGYADGIKFELNCGYSGDLTQGPLQYGEQSRKYWTHGMGIIDELGPRFIPISSGSKRKK